MAEESETILANLVMHLSYGQPARGTELEIINLHRCEGSVGFEGV
jgi:hypothetical protein